MAGFKTHIATSTVLGVGYGSAAFLLYEAPPGDCLLAAGLCSVSGMLPDLDSDSGVPVRESISFAAAVVPMLMIHRFQTLGMSPETMVLASGAIYLAIRFGVAEIFKRFTVHRGMWHSIPACLIAGLLAFLICSGGDLNLRFFKAGAVMLGFLSHLVLDELWSVDVRHFRLKSSFGTALKFWGKSGVGNLAPYATFAALAVVAVGDPILMHRFGMQELKTPHVARQLFQTKIEPAKEVVR